MRTSVLITAGLAVCTFGPGLRGAPLVDKIQPAATTSSAILDGNDYVNANLVLAFAPNNGNIFYDSDKLLGKNAGFYYPYVSVPDILSGQYNKTLVYAGGLWLGGKVAGQTRVTVAEYSSEYAEGPMSNGTFVPGYRFNSRFRAYHLYRDSLAGNPNADYIEWPVDLGAPTDSLGKPLCLGDQTIWTVYNDADAVQHSNSAGNSLPMGIEVQQTVWSQYAYNDETAVYVKYKLYNKGSNQISDFYMSFWVDPDLGGTLDDVVGCDTLNNVIFCYNGGPDDTVYGSRPPAWGGMVVSGPVVPSPGGVASFDFHALQGYRNLGMTAFTKYVTGADPVSAATSYNFMRGLNADGAPYTYDGRAVRYMYSGDPMTGTGDVDATPGDVRMMATFGPVNFYPGDSQQLVLKFAVGQAWNPAASVQDLKSILATNPALTVCDSVMTKVVDEGTLNDVDFLPASQRWLSAYIGGSLLSTTYAASDSWGSALDPSVFPDSFVTVEIRFSRTTTQKAYRYLYWEGTYAGYFEVPFTVWDADHNRQLNVAFTEDPYSNTFDSAWGPDNVANYGGHEYIYVFSSDYSGGDPNNSPIKYAERNLRNDAHSLDLLYTGRYAVADGHSLDELIDGQKLVLIPQRLNKNGITDSLDFRAIEPGDTVVQRVIFDCSSIGYGIVTPSSSEPSVFSVVREGLTLAQRRAMADQLLNGTVKSSELKAAQAAQGDSAYYYKVLFAPATKDTFGAQLFLTDGFSGLPKGSVKLTGTSWLTCCIGTTGNVDGDPYDIVDISDISVLIDYLFAGGSISDCSEESDADRSGTVDISDLTVLADYLFGSGSLPACP
jgi:hypothetical protein